MRNKIYEAFENITAENDLKKSTKEYVLAYKYRKKRTVRKMCAAIASLVCVIAGLGTGLLYYTPVAALSIDSDSSMELSINAFGKVISVKGYDENGVQLAEEFDVEGMNYKDALNEIIVLYMENDEDVFVSVSGDDKILEGALECSQGQVKVQCEKAEKDNDTTAHAAGMTVGKYKAFLELQEVEPEFTIDEAGNMSMKEIKIKINENGQDAVQEPTMDFDNFTEKQESEWNEENIKPDYGKGNENPVAVKNPENVGETTEHQHSENSDEQIRPEEPHVAPETGNAGGIGEGYGPKQDSAEGTEHRKNDMSGRR